MYLKIFSFLYTAPTMPPTTIAAVNTSSTSIRVEWSEILPRYRHGIVRQYRIFYREENAFLNNTKNFTVTSNETRIYQPNSTSTSSSRRRRAVTTPLERFATNITGLKIFTNYSIQIRGITILEGPDSSPIVVITDEDREFAF